MRVRFAGILLVASCAAHPSQPPAHATAPMPTAPPAPPPTAEAVPEPPEARALAFVDDVANHRFDAAARRFDPDMAAALPVAALADLWRKVEEASGPLRAVEGAESTVESDLRVVRVTCRFAHLRKVLRLAFGDGDAISGFHVGPVPRDLEDSARALVDHLAHADYRGASAGFDPLMQASLPPDKLRAVWAHVQKKSGPFAEIESATVTGGEGFWVVLMTCRLRSGPLVVKVVYDFEDRVAGLLFVPGDALAPWKPPSYAREDRFTEREVAVGSAPALAGTLTVPAGAGPHPVVILVHGSGPSDADATLGPNKVFKDLAWGLASRGVAALRYVKRTRALPAPVSSVKEEVLDAAHAAVHLARTTPGLDSSRVVVAGYSQGGHLAPRIAAEAPGVAGLVLLAAPSRPMQESLLEQQAYFLKLDPRSVEQKRLLAAARAFKARLEDPLLRPDDLVELPGGGSERGAYFLSLRGYDPTATAAGLTLPMLVLQGDRDYQVTTADWEGWKRALGGRPRVSTKRYPALNHLLIAGSGTPRPGEYQTPGHVAEEIVTDIAAFVGSL